MASALHRRPVLVAAPRRRGRMTLEQAADRLGVPVASPHRARRRLVTAQLFLVVASRMEAAGVRTARELVGWDGVLATGPDGTRPRVVAVARCDSVGVGVRPADPASGRSKEGELATDIEVHRSVGTGRRDRGGRPDRRRRRRVHVLPVRLGHGRIMGKGSAAHWRTSRTRASSSCTGRPTSSSTARGTTSATAPRLASSSGCGTRHSASFRGIARPRACSARSSAAARRRRDGARSTLDCRGNLKRLHGLRGRDRDAPPCRL